MLFIDQSVVVIVTCALLGGLVLDLKQIAGSKRVVEETMLQVTDLGVYLSLFIVSEGWWTKVLHWNT